MADYDWKDETAEPLADVTYLLAIKDTGVGAEPLEEALVDATTIATNASVTAAVAAFDHWTYVRLTSDATSSSTSAANTSLAFTPAANKRYEVEGNLRIQTSLAATGPRPALDWPTGLSGGSYYMVGPTAGASDAIEIFGPSGSTVGPVLLGLPLADTNYPVLIDAEFTTGGSPSGDFVVTLASETGGSAVRIMTDSFIRYREIP